MSLVGASRGWRRPEFLAAVLNGALVVIVPVVWAAYADYTWDGARPVQPTPWSSALRALPVLLVFAPVSAVVAWRTYVYARAYRLHPTTVWQGPLESAGIGGTIALAVMLPATAGTWAREPVYLVAGYIAFYVTATALVGLVLGVVLAVTALLAIKLSRCRDGGAVS